MQQSKEKGGAFKMIFTVVVLLIAAGFYFLAGGVRYELGSDYVTVGSFVAGHATVQLADIESVKMLDSLNVGTRSLGVDMYKIMGGRFTNNEYGDYKLYIYRNTSSYIEIAYTGGTVVFNQSNDEATTAAYDRLKAAVADTD